ncbi:hypothetical protein LAUMK4_05708 [Mycobacterium persicum]|uniref:DUF4333 domain-containing protein n=1 Tax=Mycobacterium persicum TaxID=1487726 RepID=A0ABY6RS45_9MYCO|nr:DUF4333 domain-containing protein [Mycobacterium persicum]VBA32261.1 hypothetical protein LAUMK4_05708 [Mycobacterium persicum]
MQQRPAPAALRQYPHAPVISPVPRQYYNDPPTQPLPRPHLSPIVAQQCPLPHGHHPAPPGATFWAPTAFTPSPPRIPRRTPRLPLWLGAAASAGAAAVLIAGFWAPGFFVTHQLDISAVQAGVTHVLSDPAGYGAKNVSDVTCNDGRDPTISKGGTFTCQATIDRIKHQFVVTFTDDAGSYEISAPKGTKV